MKNISISVIINTKNSANTLKRCLESVKWSDDIVIVDMHSTDSTKEIAASYTKKIFDYDDVGFVEPARNFAISKAKNEWIFVVDADEEIPKSLTNKLQDLIDQAVDVYDIPRKNMFFGKWLEHTGYWPDYQRRLFRKGHVVWQDTIHSIPLVTGKIKKLPAKVEYAIIHHNYQTIEQYIDRLNRYTSIEAHQRQITKPAESLVISEGFNELFRRYFKDEGFKDNLHGMSVSLLQMFYQVITQLKMWQKQGFVDSANSINQAFPEIIKAGKYWYAFYRMRTSTNGVTKLYWRIRMHFFI